MFQGFSDETVDFLWGLRFNNEKPWFEARRDIYQRALRQPMSDLKDAAFAHISQRLPDCELTAKVSRIYRDARRLGGHGPLRDHSWLSVEPPAPFYEWADHPSFWFEVNPEGWSAGLGYWRPAPATMRKLRARAERDPKKLEKLTRAIRRNPDLTLETFPYKKPRTAPSRLLEPWFNAKGFMISASGAWSERLYAPEFEGELLAWYDALIPLYQYMLTLPSEPDPNDEKNGHSAGKDDPHADRTEP